jgi:hypothetical protein
MLIADQAAAQRPGPPQRPSLQQRPGPPKGPTRFVVTLGAGVQAAMPSFNDRFEFFRPVDQAESASADADFDGKAALLIDGGFAVRMTPSFGAGVAVSRFNGSASADVVAQIPHPFEFNRFREVAGTSPGLDNTELAYHVQLQYARPITRRVRLVLSGGPTYFDVRRQVVSGVEVDETFPYDTAAFRRASTTVAKGSGLGFNAGADVVWTVNRNAGLGVLVRYARASVDLDSAARNVSVDVGGLQATGGLRLHF